MERELKNEVKEQIWNRYFFHHTRPLEFCEPTTIEQVKGIDDDFERAYQWLEAQVGFYPLFLAVGNTTEDIRMTGYDNQWKKVIGWEEGKNVYRQPSDKTNYVMFSYFDLPEGVFMDYANWHLVLNGQWKNYQFSNGDLKSIFKPSYTKSDWLRFARKNPHRVQYVVPKLDLTKADLISARNKQTQKQLQKMGFQNVEVRRITVGPI